jgi:hypothetical protein
VWEDKPASEFGRLLRIYNIIPNNQLTTSSAKLPVQKKTLGLGTLLHELSIGFRKFQFSREVVVAASTAALPLPKARRSSRSQQTATRGHV